ncbi:MAG: phenylacetate-CoA oxygenase subunit PaaJ [Crocinitomicaceae bacterium]|nr:phenylacetate-CoA oxygenase subunit PaaJ [Crocinitomicaceae bacterium]
MEAAQVPVIRENTEAIWEVLETIPDPEIPVISVVELGVVRDVLLEENKTQVIITPTYSGCPAMKQFEDDIVSTLESKGFPTVEVKMVFSPAWTTDWMTNVAREKLRRYGIAPPQKGSQDKGVLFDSGPKAVNCPQCNSSATELLSQFGSTACKAVYKCKDCQETFDYFKCI